MKTASDPLLKTVEEICACAQKLGFVIFYGWAYDEEPVHWNEEHGGDWETFLETAKTLDVKVLYLDWAPFEEFQVEEALENIGAEAPDSSEPEKGEIEQRRHEIEKYHDKVGLTCVIDLAFIFDGISHLYQSFAEWFEDFEDLRPEEGEEEQPAREERDKSLVNEWGTTLAKHPNFGRCKTHAQREYLLEGLAKEEYEKLPIAHILSRAQAVYAIEVLPKEEEQFRSEARKLRNQGMPLTAIRLKLGISKDRLSALLPE